MLAIWKSVDPFTVLLALLPLIGYFAMFGLIRVSGRGIVTTSGRDIAALAIAISGMLAVGPAELFFPTTAATMFGPTVWLALAAFYALSVCLVVLSSPPKLVVYGRTPEEVYEPLLRAAQRMDPQANGDATALQVHMPQAQIHMRIDGQRGIDHAKILAFETVGPANFWNTMLGHLRSEVAQDPHPIGRRGVGMLTAAIALGAILLWQSIGNQALVVEGFRDWLWR